MSLTTSPAGKANVSPLRLMPGATENSPTQRPFLSRIHEPESPFALLSESPNPVTKNALVTTLGRICKLDFKEWTVPEDRPLVLPILKTSDPGIISPTSSMWPENGSASWCSSTPARTRSSTLGSLEIVSNKGHYILQKARRKWNWKYLIIKQAIWRQIEQRPVWSSATPHLKSGPAENWANGANKGIVQFELLLIHGNTTLKISESNLPSVVKFFSSIFRFERLEVPFRCFEIFAEEFGPKLVVEVRWRNKYGTGRRPVIWVNGRNICKKGWERVSAS